MIRDKNFLKGSNAMIADKMIGMVQNSSAIRAMFEEGKRLAAIYGADKEMCIRDRS